MSASLYFAAKGASPWTTHLEGGTFQKPGPETPNANLRRETDEISLEL